VKASEFRIEVRGQKRVVHPFVQGEKMRVSRPDAGPDDRRTRPAKRADTFDRKEKGRNPHLRELLPQPPFRLLPDVTQKSERQLHLIRSQPANASNRRAQGEQSLATAFRQPEGDEESRGHLAD